MPSIDRQHQMVTPFSAFMTVVVLSIVGLWWFDVDVVDVLVRFRDGILGLFGFAFGK